MVQYGCESGCAMRTAQPSEMGAFSYTGLIYLDFYFPLRFQPVNVFKKIILNFVPHWI